MRKEYILPSGNKVYVQGYEPYAITELLKLYSETDFTVLRNEIPTITYKFENKEHTYFPDIYIPKENRIIEIKSTWTYTKYIDKNMAKLNACKEQGYDFEFWVYDKKYNKELIK